MNRPISICWLWVLLLISGAAFAQEDSKPVTRTYAIQNVNIVTSPGNLIPGGTVVIQNGLITAVGPQVTIPADAEVIQADSMFVYAGFISGLSHAALVKQEPMEKPKGMVPASPPNDFAGITPDRDVADLLDPGNKSVKNHREAGFLITHSVPEGKMLPGQGAILLMSGETPDEMILRKNISLYSQFAGSQGVYPNTTIGIMSKWREMYIQAQHGIEHDRLYSQNPIGIERPEYNRAVNAFKPVVQRTLSVYWKTESVLEAYRAMALKKEFGFNLVLGELKEGWDIVNDIKNSNTAALLSLDLPKDKTKKDGDAGEKEVGDDPLKQELARLEKRQAEWLTKYRSQAAVMQNAGINFGFATVEVKPSDIQKNLRIMVENGLSENSALAALTTTPARILGISNITGTVEPGKMANIVVTSAPYFQEGSKIRFVFVDGDKYEIKVKEKKKRSDEEVVLAGKWSYLLDIPDGSSEGVITFTGDEGDYTGSITNDQSSNPSDLDDVSVDGNEITFSFNFEIDGQMMTIDVTMHIEDDECSGSMTVPEYGSFDFEGERLPEFN